MKHDHSAGVSALLFALKQLLGCYYIAVRTAMQNLVLGASNVKRYYKCQHSTLFSNSWLYGSVLSHCSDPHLHHGAAHKENQLLLNPGI